MQGNYFNGKESDHMSLEGFSACVRLDIQRMFKDAEVTVQKVVKTNDVKLQSLVIRELEGSNLSPSIYLEGFYNRYLQGMELEEIEQDILKIYRRNKASQNLDVEFFEDWDKVKEKIVFKLVNFDMNREYLKDMPYFSYLDLAVTFNCFLEMGQLGSGNISIKNSHMEMWHVTKKELWDAAYENTRRILKPVLKSMEEAIHEALGESMEGLYANCCMYILSNRCNLNGASSILYNDVLKAFAERMDTDFYILPSSIHEVILVPLNTGGDVEMYNMMVKSVNAEQVEPEEILSDHVYLYTRKTGKIIAM